MRRLTWHEGRHRRRSHRPLRPAIPRDRALESGPSGTSLSNSLSLRFNKDHFLSVIDFWIWDFV